jgi:choline-glycine betaine transporter
VISFFAKVSRGRTFALVIVGLIVLQIAFAAFAAVLPLVGLFHGGNALAILVVAALAARRPIGVAHD